MRMNDGSEFVAELLEILPMLVKLRCLPVWRNIAPWLALPADLNQGLQQWWFLNLAATKRHGTCKIGSKEGYFVNKLTKCGDFEQA